jgi:hypothetical protein
MTKAEKTAQRIERTVNRVNRRKLHNNTQRVLLSLLTANGGWVSRTALRVPSAASRIRDLRTEEFGGFEIECASATELERQVRTARTKNQTYYRLKPNSVRVGRLLKVFEGAINEA